MASAAIRRRCAGCLLPLIVAALLGGARHVEAGAYVYFTSPSYSQTNYFAPASIEIEGVASDYMEDFSAYGLFTSVTVWADAEWLGDALIETGSNSTTWRLTWTHPPPPPAKCRLTVVAASESGSAATSSIGIAISPTNTLPVAQNTSARTVEATPVTLNPYYQHGDAAQTCALAVATQPLNGTVTVESQSSGGVTGGGSSGNYPEGKLQPCFVYTPETGFIGTNAFTFRVNDGYGDSNVATGTVTVATNTPPIARNVTNAIVVGAASNLTIYPSCIDPDSGVQVLRPIVVTGTAHGSIEATNNGYRSWFFLYAVPNGFVGSDTFTYKINDGLADSNVATGLVNIVSNTPPIAYPMRGSTSPTTTVALTATYLDADQALGVWQSFSARATTPPARGTLATNGLTFRYTPEAGFAGGIDSFRFVVSDGVDESGEAECRVQVRAKGDRAGNVVVAVVNSNLYVNLSNEVSRLLADLSGEGYAVRLRLWPSSSTSASNLWGCLRQEFNDTNQWLTGAIFIGNVPKGKVTIGGSAHYTDQIYWNMSRYQADSTPNRRDIWVSRIIAENATYGDEVTLIRRALNANHDYRTGASRLPFSAFYFINPEWWSGYSNDVNRLLDVWPALECRGAVKSALRFAPARTELSGYIGADAFVRGGELFDETSHGNADGYMANAGWFTRADLFRVIAQQRVALIVSCSSGAYGGIVNNTIFTRGGGCVLAVGGSELNYVGDFTIVGSWRAPFRAALAAGESWGGAMLASYPFSGAERTMMYGDLSMGAMASGASNAMPVIRSWGWQEKAGRQVTFTVNAEDSDGEVANVEWFCEGYDAGRRAPSGAGSATSLTYTYPAPGTYAVRVEVTDDRLARDWREFTVTVQGPPPRPMLMLTADNRVSNLFVNGQAASVGPNAADWTKIDTLFVDELNCLAVKAVNDQPGSNSAGVLAKAVFPDGHAEISDGSWRVYDATAGAPADDAQGRPWYAPDYDDSDWPAAAEAGAFGVSPWGRPAGLEMLAGARWIWAGDPAHGVSPVYLRRRFRSWAASDSDGDGLSDAQESIAGTDPTNGQSRFVLGGAIGDDGQPNVFFDAVSGRSYTVWSRASLATGGWEVLDACSNLWITNSGFLTVGGEAGADPARFYRLGVSR